MTTLTDEDMRALEEKEIANALAKVNGGGALTRHERELLKQAHERSRGTVTTELGLEVPVGEAALSVLEDEGRWPDLTRLKARRPEVLRTAAMLLGFGTPVRTVCEVCRLSPCTVQAIKDDPVLGQSVVSQKAETLTQMKLAMRLSIEHHVEQAKAGKLDMLSTKMLFEMIQVLDGGATSRTEHVVTIKTDADEALWRLVQDTRQMGLLGENLGAVAELPAAPVRDVEAVGVTSEVPHSPLSVNGMQHEVSSPVSNEVQNAGPDAGNFSPGGEGVEPLAALRSH